MNEFIIFFGVLAAIFGWSYLRRRQFRQMSEHYEAGDWPAATQAMRRALRLRPRDPTAYYNLALIRERQGDLQGALDYYNRAIKLNPRYIDAYIRRAHLHLRLDNQKAALLDFDQAVRLDPDNSMSRSNRSMTYVKIGNFDAALRDCDELERIATDGLAKVERHGAYIGGGDMQPGLKRQLGASYLLRAAVYVRQGRFEEALGLYDKSEELMPDEKAAIDNDRGEAYFEMGNYEQALDHFIRADSGEFPNARAGQAITQWRLGRREAAVALWQELSAQDESLYQDAERLKLELNWTDTLADTALEIISHLTATPTSANIGEDNEQG